MQKTKPDILLSNYKINIEKDIQRSLEEQKPSEAKVMQTQATAIKYLKEADSLIKKLLNKKNIESDYISYYINGEINYILEKSTFCDDQEADNVDFDSFVPSIVKDNFLNGFYHSFMTNTERYVIEKALLEKALEKLDLNIDEHLIICFGENLQNNIPNNGIKKVVIKNDEYYHQFMFNSIIILRKDDLPQIIYKDYPEDVRKKYFLTIPIDKDLKLYAAVNDLNEKTELRNELQENYRDKNLKEYVLQCLWINPEIRWKKGARKVMIVQHSKFREDGILSNLNDIRKFGIV
jgi:hypothetical protein